MEAMNLPIWPNECEPVGHVCTRQTEVAFGVILPLVLEIDLKKSVRTPFVRCELRSHSIFTDYWEPWAKAYVKS